MINRKNKTNSDYTGKLIIRIMIILSIVIISLTAIANGATVSIKHSSDETSFEITPPTTYISYSVSEDELLMIATNNKKIEKK